MASHQRVIPMPRWASPVGCVKLVFSLAVLALIATCIAIWGGGPASNAALGFTLFTACFSITVFGYYFLAIVHRRKFYRSSIILGLEVWQSISWIVCTTILALWVSHRWNLSTFRTHAQHVRYRGPSVVRAILNDLSNLSKPLPERMAITHAAASKTPVTVHGQHQRHVACVLALTAAVLSGIQSILYLTLLSIFCRNLWHNITQQAAPRTPIDGNDDLETGPDAALSTDISADIEATRAHSEAISDLSINSSSIPIPEHPPTIYETRLNLEQHKHDNAFEPARPPSLVLQTPTRTNTDASQISEKAFFTNSQEAVAAGFEMPTPLRKAVDAETAGTSVMKVDKGKGKGVDSSH